MSGYYFSQKIVFFILLSEDFFIFTNSVGPDEMQHDAAFHLGLHSLPKYSFRGFRNTKGYLGIKLMTWFSLCVCANILCELLYW